jgi:hypothetical protein
MKIHTEVVMKVKRLREKNSWDFLHDLARTYRYKGQLMEDAVDPAEADPELRRKLEETSREFSGKMQELIDSMAEKQVELKAEPKEVSDEGAEETDEEEAEADEEDYESVDEELEWEME